MKITIEDLKKLNGCSEGIATFQKEFPSGIDVPEWDQFCQAILLFSKCRKWIGWAWKNRLIPMWSLQNAYLRGAKLQGADLQGADLRGAAGIK